MPKLSDTQRLLLSSASQRDSGSLIPLPSNYSLDDVSIQKAFTGLLRSKLIEERAAPDIASAWRDEGDARTGLFVTTAGLRAIGIDNDAAPTSDSVVVLDAANATATAPRPATKTAQVVALLQRDTGATLPDLIAATGWLPHTTRAALTGLRKKGHAIERSKRQGATCYRIVATAA